MKLAAGTPSRPVVPSPALIWAVLWAAGLAPPVVAPPPSPGDYTLIWDALPACPSADELRFQLERLLSGPPAGMGTIEVVGRVTSRDGMMHLRLTSRFRGQVDERHFEAASCRPLSDAAVVFLAVALEPGLHAPPREAQEVSTSEEAPVAPLPEPPVESNVLEPPNDESWVPAERSRPSGEHEALPSQPNLRHRSGYQPFLRIGVGPEFGILGAFALGVSAGVGIAGARWSASVDGLYLAPRRLPESSGPGAMFQYGGVGLRGCLHGRLGKVEVPACLGVEGGVVRADSRGLLEGTVQHGPWIAPMGMAGLMYPAGRWRWWGAVQVGLAVYRTHFIADDARAVDAFPATFRLLLGTDFALRRSGHHRISRSPRRPSFFATDR